MNHRVPTPVALLIVAMVVAGCTTPGSSPTGTAGIPSSLGPRPSSSATVEIVQPEQGATVTGTTVHVVLQLTGGRIVDAGTTAIRPDQGHVHLYVNNLLVSMNYGLEQDIPVNKGTIALRAEFVAADHAPFNPRVETPDVVFTVH